MRVLVCCLFLVSQVSQCLAVTGFDGVSSSTDSTSKCRLIILDDFPTAQADTGFQTVTDDGDNGVWAVANSGPRTITLNGGDDEADLDKATMKADTETPTSSTQKSESEFWVDLYLEAKTTDWTSLGSVYLASEAITTVEFNHTSGTKRAKLTFTFTADEPDATASIDNSYDMTLMCDAPGSHIEATWDEANSEWDLSGSYLDSSGTLQTVSESQSGNLSKTYTVYTTLHAAGAQMSFEANVDHSLTSPPLTMYHEHGTGTRVRNYHHGKVTANLESAH